MKTLDFETLSFPKNLSPSCAIEGELSLSEVESRLKASWEQIKNEVLTGTK